MLFWPLLKAEMYLLKKKLTLKLVDSIIWGFSTTWVSAFVLPAFGMPDSYGVFKAAGLLVSIISFELFSNIFDMVFDIENTGYLKYLLTLPQSAFTIIFTKAIVYMINGLVAVSVVFPVASLLLIQKIDFFGINYFYLLISTLVTSLFFGWFTVFLAQRVKDTSQVRSTQVRILFPLWYFGGFSFSFKVAFFKVSKVFGLICLLSPYTFATEATRSAILGPQDYIPFWASIGVLMLFTTASAAFGFYGLKKRLDFV